MFFIEFSSPFFFSVALSRKSIAFVGSTGAIGDTVHFMEAHGRPLGGTEARYRVSASLRSTHNQDGAIVLDVQSGQIFRLNYVGSQILELLKSSSSIGYSEIADRISLQFAISHETAYSDIGDFLGQLAARHLIEEESPDSAA